VSSAIGIDAAIADLSRKHAEALLLIPDSFTIANRAEIIDAALRAGIPAVSVDPTFARDGALATYSEPPEEGVRRIAYYIDRILRWERPGELPVEEPSRLELTINLKSATMLGIRIPRSLLIQATEIIQ
jgi:putative ABC transport system substrate-binding protein